MFATYFMTVVKLLLLLWKSFLQYCTDLVCFGCVCFCACVHAYTKMSFHPCYSDGSILGPE